MHNHKRHRAGDLHPWPRSRMEDQDRFKVAPGKRMSWEWCRPSSGKPQTALSLSLQMLVSTTTSQIVLSNWHIRVPNRHRWCPKGVRGHDNSTQKSNVIENCERTNDLPWLLLLLSFSRGGVSQPVSGADWMIHVLKQMLYVLIFGWSRGAEGFGSPFKWIHISSPLTFPATSPVAPALPSIYWRVTDVMDPWWTRLWVMRAFVHWWQGCSGIIGCCRADGSKGGLCIIHVDSHGD